MMSKEGSMDIKAQGVACAISHFPFRRTRSSNAEYIGLSALQRD